MKLKTPKNLNYCATVVEIKNIIPLEGMDNVVHTSIMGNLVITSKDTQIGDVGLYFPVETQLGAYYCRENNLFKDSKKNLDETKRGYLEDNRRIKCVRFRGFASEGLFMPITSLSEFIEKDDLLCIGDEFDELNGELICNKYVVAVKTSSFGSKKLPKLAKESKIIDNQFRFHDDTTMLYRNLNKFNSNDLISITYKVHGTSGISSKVLCKRNLKWYEKLLKKVGVRIIDTQYDYIYASRKVIKNPELNPNANHYYGEDIWGIAHRELESYLTNGMTLYYEIVGFLPNGGWIQKGYDYGCEANQHKVYIYRITHTNSEGKVFEFSAKQVQEWCKINGLNAVPELYYGKVKDFYAFRQVENWQEDFLSAIKLAHNEKKLLHL